MYKNEYRYFLPYIKDVRIENRTTEKARFYNSTRPHDIQLQKDVNSKRFALEKPLGHTTNTGLSVSNE